MQRSVPGNYHHLIGAFSTDGVTWQTMAEYDVSQAISGALFDSTQSLMIGSQVDGSQAWDGRIYSVEMDKVNLRQFVFSNGNYLMTPDDPALDITGDIEIVANLNPDSWRPSTVQTVVSKILATGNNASYRLSITQGANIGRLVLSYSLNGSTTFGQMSSVVVPSTAEWIKATRVAATGTIQFFTAGASVTEPTTWTKLGADVPSNTGAIFSGAAPVWIGETPVVSAPFTGRIRRVIIRNGIAGTTVLDVTEGNAAGWTTGTFTATTGQVITANGTPIQAAADQLVWRFDAADYPGSGTTYSDPRGRSWTISAGHLIPADPGAPTTWVDAVEGDVCPEAWEMSHLRSETPTQVIIGRAAVAGETSPPAPFVLDDTTAQRNYGVETWSQTDLLTQDPQILLTIGNRTLKAFGANTAPRVKSVTLQPSSSDTALRVCATASPFPPARYRCRLLTEERTVFDREMFVTSVNHSLDAGRWTVRLGLDDATAFRVVG